jgi:peptidyl-prolyl cis-trans isomerase C
MFPMKSIALFLFSAAAFMWAQAPPDIKPDTVVATIDGKPMTAGEWAAIVAANPPEAQQNFLTKGPALLQRLALFRKLAAMAEQEHIDQQSPWKEQLEQQRMQTLANAKLALAQTASSVSADEQKKFYDENRDLLYSQARVKILYVAFSADPTAKVLSEAQAKAKIEKLLAQVRGGADFVKLVKENSDDADSKAKDGDFGTPILRSDNLPPEILKAIFGLKQGEVSDPVRTTSGFYLYRMEDLTVQPYDQVKDNIFIQIQAIKFKDWYQGVMKSVDVKITKPEFFTPPPAGPASGSN